MLSNRRASIAPAASSDPRADHRVSVCNPRPAWRRTNSFNVNGGLDGNNLNLTNDLLKGDQPHCALPSILTSTTAQVPGYAVRRNIGSIYGTTTGALPKDGVKLWIRQACGMGSEVRNMTALLYQMREVAMERMVMDCVSRGGNAVVGVTYSEAEMMGVVTVSAQGTAVFVEPARRGAMEEENPFKEES